MSILLTQAVAPAADLSKIGQQQFLICGACHGQQGEGTAAGPPLAGSEWVNGPVENLVKLQMRGLIGPIEVKGQQYNFPGGMQPMAYQTDEQIAAVLSYVRSSFGNKSSAVTIEEVKALRAEAGKPQLNASELIQPEKTSAPTTTESGEPLPIPAKYKDMHGSLGAPIWLAVFVVLLVLVSLVSVFRK